MGYRLGFHFTTMQQGNSDGKAADELQQEALQEFDALARIKELVDWEAFRPRLEQAFGKLLYRKIPA